jgi:hypothetical protein
MGVEKRLLDNVGRIKPGSMPRPNVRPGQQVQVGVELLEVPSIASLGLFYGLGHSDRASDHEGISRRLSATSRSDANKSRINAPKYRDDDLGRVERALGQNLAKREWHAV